MEIVRVLKHVRPKAFLLENVANLCYMHNEFQTILDALRKAGSKHTQHSGFQHLTQNP